MTGVAEARGRPSWKRRGTPPSPLASATYLQNKGIIQMAVVVMKNCNRFASSRNVYLERGVRFSGDRSKTFHKV
jgi:hypothetical protein